MDLTWIENFKTAAVSCADVEHAARAEAARLSAKVEAHVKRMADAQQVADAYAADLAAARDRLAAADAAVAYAVAKREAADQKLDAARAAIKASGIIELCNESIERIDRVLESA